jgi:hypothetical protein
MPGAMSDADREFLVSTVPGLGTTPEGNRVLLEARRRLARRQQEVAEFVDEYATAHGGNLDGGVVRAIRERFSSRPLFDDLRTRVPRAAGTFDDLIPK